MSSEHAKTKAKKIIAAIPEILSYVFFAVCMAVLALSVSVKKDADGAASLWGTQIRVVVSDSMAKSDATDVSPYKIKDIPVKSMVFIDLVPEDEQKADEWYEALQVGDVLTFRYVYVKQETITHRITKITPKQTGGYIIELTGDNRSSDTDTLQQTIDTSLTDSPNYVIGKVVGQSYVIGLLMTAVKSPVGIVCIVIIPSLIIAVFEIFRITGVLLAGKRKRRDDEFEEMKRQLELLQKRQQDASNTDAPFQSSDVDNETR